MKFLHTADWQLGARSVQAGLRAKEVREKRFEVAEVVVDLAQAEKVDFVIIAGDTFEDHDVDELVVRKTVRLLDGLAPIPVYVLPGNHDPLIPGGVWDRESWKRIGDHVHLLQEPNELEIGERVVIYPCPLTQKRSTQDPTSDIPARQEDDDRIRIGVAHGALAILPEGGSNFPIHPDRAEECDLDYLALGDWHSTLEHGRRTAYSGTIEATGFGEKDPGHVLIVEIGAAGDAPAILQKSVGALRWVAREVEIKDRTDIEALESEIQALGTPDKLLLRLCLQLASDADSDMAVALDALCEELDDTCFLFDLDLDDSAYVASLDVDLPEGVLAQADEALTQILEGSIPEGPGRGFASEEREIVEEAQALLHRLAGSTER